jgi:hypothetical protein
VSGPTRADVEARWRDIVAGRRSREDVHAWTRPWVEGDGNVEDPLVSLGLSYLHGFDMTVRPAEPHLVGHGMEPGRVYCKSDVLIAEELASWEESVAFYDSDQEGWHRRKWLRLIRALQSERGLDAARAVADRAIALGQLDEASATRTLDGRDTTD